MTRFTRFLSILLLLPIVSFADVNGDLVNFFNGLGFSSNATNPSVYQGQAAGYYNGGSLYMRDGVRDVQIAEVDLPSFKSGCGGIDLYAGGFSFINSQELVDTMKNVMNNAMSYAFLLATEEALPEGSNVMKYAQTIANDINRANINSCETAEGLVGSVWPKTHEAQKQVCQDIGSNTGIFSDYAAARQGCGPGGDMSSTLDGAQGAYKNLVVTNTNIAWKALNQNAFLAADPQLAEFFMSLSGSIIISNAPGTSGDMAPQQTTILSSLATDPNLIKALLHGGTVSIYACDEFGKCLYPSQQNVTISESNSLQAQVEGLLNDMVNKIFTDQPLTQAEIGLLNATRLPVYKMLDVDSAFDGNESLIDIENYSNVIATDILFQYLEECLAIIRASSGDLQYPPQVLEQFNKGIEVARDQIRQTEASAYTQISMTSQLISQTQTLEGMLSGTLSTNLNSTLTWASNIRSGQ